ncbi:MAG: DUF3810 family protein [Trueperaceae bacterium]
MNRRARGDVAAGSGPWWASRLLATAAAAWLVAALARWVPSWNEAWAHLFAPGYAAVVTRLGEGVPWPWTPPLALLVAVLAVRAARSAGSRGRATVRVVAAFLLITASFELAWGLHGTRPPAQERLAERAQVPERTMEAPLASLLRDRIVADLPNGPLQEREATASVREALQELAPTMRLPRTVRVVPGWVLGPWGVAGVVSPWTYEAHVDGALPPWSRIAIAAHELAHLAGYEDEADAELLGLLAALRAQHPHARYAGALRAWAWLPAEDRSLAGPLPERARSDLAAARAVHEGRARPFAGAFTAAYDAWLRLRGQEAGVGGYAIGPRRLAWAWRAGLW